ncbi:putative X-linked retinitis pigmentosa GTPase regulator [Carpediemonas membranifera]|uniref:Putative X-linked retinitis pigmentosa GTPase regulator n=1 Tax=Carpediemonas membranifera TaxID=201153 RepID=A0A8J6AQC6_9EUKA|nr:putative X-linked retinitis pigmentosa GTPase regulator [Carpediemonas membranifera]|eukprot:KAG9391261.1 putative X-linked retinitis pigmentosa GTPase regulator [Carpediemonas membranifera]
MDGLPPNASAAETSEFRQSTLCPVEEVLDALQSSLKDLEAVISRTVNSEDKTRFNAGLAFLGDAVNLLDNKTEIALSSVKRQAIEDDPMHELQVAADHLAQHPRLMNRVQVRGIMETFTTALEAPGDFTFEDWLAENADTSGQSKSNAEFVALNHSVIWAIFLTAGFDPEDIHTAEELEQGVMSDGSTPVPDKLLANWFLSKHINATLPSAKKEGKKYDFGARFWLNAGRLFGKGSNWWGRTGTGLLDMRVDAFTRVALPPTVEMQHADYDSLYAVTRRGLYGFGDNAFGKLGVGSKQEHISVPMRISFADAPDVARFEARMKPGEYMKVRVSEGIDSIFIETPAGLVAAGQNTEGQLAAGSDRDMVLSFRQVALPPGFIFANLQIHEYNIVAKRRDKAYVAGWNSAGQLGLGHCNRVSALTPARIPVDDLWIHFDFILWKSCGLIYFTGNAKYFKAYLPGGEDRYSLATELGFPFSVGTFATDGHASFFAKNSESGQWFALGANDKAQLGVKTAKAEVTKWTKMLNAVPDEEVTLGGGLFTMPKSMLPGNMLSFRSKMPSGEPQALESITKKWRFV